MFVLICILLGYLHHSALFDSIILCNRRRIELTYMKIATEHGPLFVCDRFDGPRGNLLVFIDRWIDRFWAVPVSSHMLQEENLVFPENNKCYMPQQGFINLLLKSIV